LRWADVALIVVVFGAGLRLWRWASGLPLWLDEQMISGNLRDRGFAALTGRLDDQQSAPLGWLWTQRAVVEVFGTGERALRAVPVLFGICTPAGAPAAGAGPGRRSATSAPDTARFTSSTCACRQRRRRRPPTSVSRSG